MNIYRYGEDFYRALLTLGLSVALAPRGDWRENVPAERGVVCLALIEVRQSPIQWIRISEGAPLPAEELFFTAEYAIPDPRMIPELVAGLHITVDIRRKWFLFGEVGGFDWHGNDVGLNLLSQLTADESLRFPLMNWRGMGLQIHAIGEHRFWRISDQITQTTLFGSRICLPTLRVWRTHEAIARHLLGIFAPS